MMEWRRFSRPSRVPPRRRSFEPRLEGLESRVVLDASTSSPGFLSTVQGIIALAKPSEAFAAGQAAAQKAIDAAGTAATNQGGFPAGARLGTDLFIATAAVDGVVSISVPTATASLTAIKGAGAIGAVNPVAGTATGLLGVAGLVAAIDSGAFAAGAATAAVQDAIKSGPVAFNAVVNQLNSALSTLQNAVSSIVAATEQVASDVVGQLAVQISTQQMQPPPPPPPQGMMSACNDGDEVNGIEPAGDDTDVVDPTTGDCIDM